MMGELPLLRHDNRRADGGHLDLQHSMMQCLVKIISTMSDACEALIVFSVYSVFSVDFHKNFRVLSCYSWFLTNSAFSIQH
jgi:hypothetical protein